MEPKFEPPPDSICAATSVYIAAKPKEVFNKYWDAEGWPALFGQTISAVQIIEKHPNWVSIKVSHKKSGLVPNVMIKIDNQTIGLIENKPLFDGWFLNEFKPEREGTRFTVSGYIKLKGALAIIAPLVTPLVRWQSVKQLKRFVLEPMQNCYR